MTESFTKVKSNRLAEELISQIKLSILKNELKPGDKLPSERKLAEMYSISRVAIREALRILEKEGLLSIKRGAEGGAFVTKVNSEIIEHSLGDFFQFGDISINNISEARLIIEPAIAELASIQRTQEDLHEIKEIMSYCQRLIEEERPEIDAQVRFHYALARASKNPVLTVILNSLMKFLSNKLYLINPNLKSFTKDQEFHNELFGAIVNKNGKSAHQIMKEHVETFEKIHQQDFYNLNINNTDSQQHTDSQQDSW